MDINLYAEYTYNFSFIPIYIYAGQTLQSTYQGSGDPILIPEMIEVQLLQVQDPLSFFETSIGSYFGRLYLPSQDISIILGPVFPLSYTEDAIRKYGYQYKLPASQQESHRAFLLRIPACPLMNLVMLVYQMRYAITGIPSDLAQETLVPYPLSGISDHTQLTEHSRNNLETGYHNTFYETLNITNPLIRSGDLGGLTQYSKNMLPMNFGTYSSDLREQQLVVFILTISHAVIAAIEGGVNQQAALSMAELYIRKGLRLTSPVAIDALSMTAVMDFTKRVQEEKDTGSAPVRASIYNCIQYIHERVYTPITVAEVAQVSGYSPAHFSRTFQRETGITASRFILRCKLQEAKKLLKFTHMTIGEISSQLYFSSQSHFQKQFKNSFHMTPLAYRNASTKI